VTANTWAGPVIVKAANSTLDVVGSSYSAYASSPQSLTFAGPITVTNGSKGVVVYKAGPYALLRLGGSFTGSGLDVQAGQTVRAINDGVFPASVDAKNAGGVFEVQPGVDFCSDVGAAVLLGSVTTSVNRWSAGKAAIYTDSDTTFIKPITMHSYKVGLKHTGSGTLTFTDNLTADNSGVRGIWWLNDADNRTVFAGNKTDIALMNVTAGTVEVAEGGRVFMSAGSGSGFEIGGSGTAAKAELRISGGCLDMDLPSAGQPTGYILLGDDGAKPAKLTVTGGALTNRLYGASRSASDKAAVSQTGGEIYNYSTSNTGNKYYTPVLAARGKGFFGLHGGTYRVNGNDVIAGETNSYAVFRQTGGKIATDTSSYFMNLSRGGVGEFTMTGGELVNDNSAGYLRLGDSTTSGMGGSATMTLCGTGNPLVRIAGWLNLSARTDGFTSTLNLNAGTLECCRVYVSNKAAREGTSGAFVNFNGGRMRSSASTANLFGDNVTRPPTAITIYPEGATFDTPTGYKNYFSTAEKGIDEVMVVRSATGRGVKRIRLPEDMPRTGYAGILPVRISGGDGSCATAAMAYDPATGTVGDELIVTCPGVDYTEPPTVTVFGPDWTTEYACVVELTETEQTPGVIYKTGEGMLGFNCISNSFAGTVVVSNGTFYVPQASEIDPRIQIRCAGGMFEYDWKSRTVAEIGGFGVIKGSPNDNSAHNLTVTDGLRFNAADALAGHTLTMEDGADQSVSDRIILGESAVIWIENMELLADQDQGYSYALLRTSFPLNRLPDLAIELPEGWFIRLSDDSRTLSLYQSKGTVMLIR
jgi:hypothetical protein